MLCCAMVADRRCAENKGYMTMTLYELVTRPLTHRWVAINRTTERVVTNAELALWAHEPIKAKRAYTPRKPKA